MTSQTILQRRTEQRPRKTGAGDVRLQGGWSPSLRPSKDRKDAGETLTKLGEGNEETPTIMSTYPQAASMTLTGAPTLLERSRRPHDPCGSAEAGTSLSRARAAPRRVKTPSQSPSACWRNKRSDGCHGLSSRSIIQRQSGA